MMTLGILAPKDRPSIYEYGTRTVNTTTGSSYSFTSQAIGTAAANRYVVVTVFNRDATLSNGAATVSSVTVGGTSCTKITEVNNSGYGGLNLAMFITTSPVTTGTTATVAVTLANSEAFAAISVHAIYTSNPTPTASFNEMLVTSGNSRSVSAQDGGVVIAAYAGWYATSASWSGLDAQGTVLSFTKTYSQFLTTAAKSPTEGGSLTISVTDNGGDPGNSIVGAVWKP